MTRRIFKMRNMIAIALCLAATTIFTACGKDNNDPDNNGDKVYANMTIDVGGSISSGHPFNHNLGGSTTRIQWNLYTGDPNIAWDFDFLKGIPVYENDDCLLYIVGDDEKNTAFFSKVKNWVTVTGVPYNPSGWSSVLFYKKRQGNDPDDCHTISLIFYSFVPGLEGSPDFPSSVTATINSAKLPEMKPYLHYAGVDNAEVVPRIRNSDEGTDTQEWH